MALNKLNDVDRGLDLIIVLRIVIVNWMFKTVDLSILNPLNAPFLFII